VRAQHKGLRVLSSKLNVKWDLLGNRELAPVLTKK
jgi:hypothetical protein